MNQKLKITVILMTVIILTFSCTVVESYAWTGLPKNVKIGIYYGTFALSMVDVGSNTGLQIGYDKYGDFVKVYEYHGTYNIVVRKDLYYVNTQNGIKEYSKKSSIIPKGEKYGPYHIQIGGKYQNFKDAEKQAQILKNEGIKAYPAYIRGDYCVWSGCYTSSENAQGDIIRIQKLSGNNSCKVLCTGSNGFQVLNKGDKDIKFIFETDIRFCIKPISKKGTVPLIKINNKRYRGAVEFLRKSDSDMTVINVVDVEQYLYGVLPREMGGEWPLEALKAQAVAARTYVLMNLNKYQNYGFNLSATPASQVYGGYDGEHINCNKAVNETKGKILTYNSKPAEVYYFSTSGGHTEDTQNVWGGSVPYLKGVEDPYEPKDGSDYSHWEVNKTPKQIKKLMEAQGYDIGDILSVSVTEYSESGRAIKLKIIGTKGSKIFKKNKTRTFFGGNFYSQKYRITSDADIFVRGANTNQSNSISGSAVNILSSSNAKPVKRILEKVYVKGHDTKKSYSPVPTFYMIKGEGWGHGVGLSQWGARGMADAGFNYEQIITHYFPGTNVE